MKKQIVLLIAVLISACSTMIPKTEDLEKAESCTVWKDGILGSKTVVAVEGEVAKQKITCWVMNMFACTYTDYTFKEGSSEIRSSLPPEDKTIARLEGDKITAISMVGITADPIDIKNRTVDYSIQGPIGPKQKMTVNYSKSCTKRQAALGLMSMIAK